MVKQWVKLRLSLSVILLFSTLVFAGAKPVDQLTQNDLTRPQKIKNWLSENSTHADKKLAREFYLMGQDYVKKQNWSAAVKSFGESATFFPLPKTLMSRAEAEIKMLGMVRARKKNKAATIKSDLEYFLAMYNVVLAADDVLHTLTPEERNMIESYIECIGVYIETPASTSTCRPVQDYRG